MERKGKADESDGVSYVAVGQMFFASVLILGYAYYLLVGLPRQWEERRISAMVAMQVEGLMATPEGTQTNGGEIVAVYGATDQPGQKEIADVIERTPVPTPTAAAVIAPTAQADWNYRHVVDVKQHCFDCTVYDIQVMVTHYWPNAGNINCWQYNEETQYCESATTSELPWEYFVGIGAACPYDWPLGTWVDIANYGSVLCVDRGSMKCESGVCEVDILSQDVGAIDKTVQKAKVYINWGQP